MTRQQLEDGWRRAFPLSAALYREVSPQTDPQPTPIPASVRGWEWYSTASGRGIGGSKGTFYRNTDPNVPLGEYFVRPYPSGYGVINIPRNPAITPDGAARIGDYMVRAHGVGGKALGMTADQIARGIDGHVLGDRLVGMAGPLSRALENKMQTYDINYPLDWKERVSGVAADVLNPPMRAAGRAYNGVKSRLSRLIPSFMRKSSAARSTEYVVRPGDTLSRIARRNGLRISDIVRWNGIGDPNRLKVGARLRLGPHTTPSEGRSRPAAAGTGAGTGVARGRPAQPAQTARMPYPGQLRNPGNVRHYANDTWLGEITEGRNPGQFARFDTPQHGLRAASRVVLNIANRLGDNPTLDGIIGRYSPPNENNTARHASTVSSLSGIARDAPIDTGDTGQMVDLMRGIVGAENPRMPDGRRYSEWFTPDEYTNAVVSARTSVPVRRR